MVEILFCPTCSGYHPRAASLAAEVTKLGVEAKVTAGGRGQFDVLADGELVFSKAKRGRFPEDEEILALLRA